VVKTPSESRVIDLSLDETAFPFIPVHLDRLGSTTFTITPLLTAGGDFAMSINEFDSYVASLGLVDKYNTLSGLLSAPVSGQQSSFWSAKFKAAGTAAFYLRGPIELRVSELRVYVDHKEVEQGDLVVEKAVYGGVVLRFDMEPYIDEGPEFVVRLIQSW
jgi:hypothetical protein